MLSFALRLTLAVCIGVGMIVWVVFIAVNAHPVP
jgi:hypothetical protein